MNYIEIRLTIVPQHPWEELITHALGEIGFESFLQEENQLLAYISEENYEEQQMVKCIDEFRSTDVQIDYMKRCIPEQNWNATWEADYPAVSIDQELLIRAPFHPKDDNFKMTLEIQPHTSFGTGHHQTTYLLCKALLKVDFHQKKVLDVGTGTGVLGILAATKGAQEVWGTDIDQRAITNAKENSARNPVSNFTIVKGDIDCVPKMKFDVIVANINRNVLIRHFPNYEELLNENGVLFLSGFFETDAKKLVDVAKKFNFMLTDTFLKETWCVLKFQKQQ